MNFNIEDFLTLTMIIFVIVGIGFIGYKISGISKTEKKAKLFRESMDQGDRCYVHTSSHSIQHGDITEIGDEFVKVEIKVRKDWVYQPMLDKNNNERKH